MYTVKQLSQLAGVSIRTLHYYDEIGLLKPAAVGQNNYRYYTDEAVLRLQQILFYRELGMELTQIKAVLDAPDFDVAQALCAHRQTLEAHRERLTALIATVDNTLKHLSGDPTVSKKKIFEGFSEEKQQQYEAEAVKQWGETVKESAKLWKSYSEEKKADVLREGGEIYSAIVENMRHGPDSAEVQALLEQWHQHLRYFYEPSLETLRGLGDHYHDHPEFNATFTAIHPDLPAFLKQAIACYVDVLETKWLERELGILQE